MRIVGISDTHNRHEDIEIPECDLFIHSGDWSSRGGYEQTEAFAKWLHKQPARYIVVVPGNHERQFEKSLPISRAWILDHCPRAHILIDEGIEIEGFKIWGSPVTPLYGTDWAWNRWSGEDIDKHWQMIPLDTQLLITHGPPANILDIVYYVDGVTPKGRAGCHSLYNKVMQLDKLLHHMFGHIHCDHGHLEHCGKHFWNMAICDYMNTPTNPVTVIEI